MALVSDGKGRELYKHNAHLRRVAHFMEHPETREIYDQYFGKYDDLVCFTMFLKLYEKIEKVGPALTPYQKIEMLKRLIDDGNHRQLSVNAIQNWFKLNSNKIV